MEADLCAMFKCFCCWRISRPTVPRIAPGVDYLAIPSGADDRPVWSVVAGVSATGVPRHNLRLHRFRVAASGRVLGESDDLLECSRHIIPEDIDAEIFTTSSADLSSAGDKMHIFTCTYPLKNDGTYNIATDFGVDFNRSFRAFAMSLADGALAPLGELPDAMLGRYTPIRAGGEDWALCVERPFNGKRHRGTTRLVMLRLEAGPRWVVAADLEFPHDLPQRRDAYRNGVFQGHVVIGDKILVSLLNTDFFVFDCFDHSWERVTLKGESFDYVPIYNNGVYVEADDTIYFLHYTTLYAYKYSVKNRCIMPPILLNSRPNLCPFKLDGKISFVHLVGRVLCVVWVGELSRCECTTRHVLITTLLVNGNYDEAGDFVPEGVDILHSTCRRLNVFGTGASPGIVTYFCFLRSYVEHPNLPLMPPVLGHVTYEGIKDSPNMLNCCRMFLEDERHKGDIVLEDCKVPTKTDLYFIAEVDHHSMLYRVSISDGKLACQDKILEPECHVETLRSPDHQIIEDPPSWHFIHHGSNLSFVSSSPQHNMYTIDLDNKFNGVVETQRPDVCFQQFFAVGHHLVGVGHTLQSVYVLNRRTSRWVHWETSSASSDLTRKISVSGFAEISRYAFIISDAETYDCFLLDLTSREWTVVRTRWEYRPGMLIGRSVFIKGFIYTLFEGGIMALELVKESNSYCLERPIFLRSWRCLLLDTRLTSFASVGKEDNVSDCLVFCVVHGVPTTYAFRRLHEVSITTMQVMLRETGRGTSEPIDYGHVDMCTSSSISHEGLIHASYAFAA